MLIFPLFVALFFKIMQRKISFYFFGFIYLLSFIFIGAFIYENQNLFLKGILRNERK